MRPTDLIALTRDGVAPAAEDLRSFIAGIAEGTIPDYQAAAFLMAVYLQGLSDELTVTMTLAMRDSGRVIQHNAVSAPKVDKHSTGGVGDKISLPLAPLVAACGVPVPMISGRGLGHTGGTLDKLESIPDFEVNLGVERFQQQVAELGICLIGQTEDLAPADRKLYALRDVTATVESIPLITSSILSKKLAEGIDALVLDVKAGRGAFMKDETSARKLAHSLVRVGRGAGLRITALLTRMEEPLGRTIGNALELTEALEILQGEGPPDTTELTMALGAEMLLLGGAANTLEEGRRKLEKAVSSGAGLELFRRVVEAQGGNPKALDDPSLLPTASSTRTVDAPRAGFVEAVDGLELGLAAMRLGAGRSRTEDIIDPGVGLEVLVRVGDPVEPGQPLLRVHHNGLPGDVLSQCQAAVTIGDVQPERPRLIMDRIQCTQNSVGAGST